MDERCNYCGYIGVPVFVHGHYQCAKCGVNSIPCCNGECEKETPAATPVKETGD